MTEISAEVVKGIDDNYHIKSVARIPAQRLNRGAVWMNQKVEFITHLYGKEYYWMRDGDGTVYLAKVGTDGMPVLI